MDNNDYKKYIEMVIMMLPQDRISTEEEIRQAAIRFKSVFSASDQEVETVVKHVESKVPHTMQIGTPLISEELQRIGPWLESRRSSIIPFYWNRYESYLVRNKGWERPIIMSLSQITDDILDLLGDPNDAQPFKRKGLVVGEVQSGKTSTYTALCGKAADAGYKLIILLTGNIEALRRQTQERIDEGFVGRESLMRLIKKPEDKYVGVGLIDHVRNAEVFTSTESDFNSSRLNSLNVRLSSFSEPVILVLKKNAGVLNNLYHWLKVFNIELSDDHIGLPMLMIDDEADNASINTRVSIENSTIINQRIRDLLSLFTHSNYVGFTATPFANIFIDSEQDDLFPDDFIYSLNPPSNYYGSDFYFGEDSAENEFITEIDEKDNDPEIEKVIPINHRIDYHVPFIPKSLREAIMHFILTNSIRDLRADLNTHRSMLINVSRFTAVQEQFRMLVYAALTDIKKEIALFSGLVPEEALVNGTMLALYETWLKYFESKAEFDWIQVQGTLHTAISPIEVRCVNANTGASSLNYREYKNYGLRMIAIGGNSLSRGLTLEGLSTSYFYRNSLCYDTLLQMGRWFGYREGYSDLCRIWMSKETRINYAHIHRAVSELKEEIVRMRQLNMRPKDFGLKVLAHPDALLITARNKMRTARPKDVVTSLVSLSGRLIETPRISSIYDINETNIKTCSRFINSMLEAGHNLEMSDFGNHIFKNVECSLIIDFLDQIIVHDLNFEFQPASLSNFFRSSTESIFENWDVVIPKGEKQGNEPFSIPDTNLSVRRQRRQISASNYRSLLISRKSSRVGSRGITREGLDRTKARKIENEYKSSHDGKNPSDREYLVSDRKPLLILHYLSFDEEKTVIETGIAFGIGLPRFTDKNERYAKYYLTKTAYDQYYGNDDVEDDYEVDT